MIVKTKGLTRNQVLYALYDFACQYQEKYHSHLYTETDGAPSVHIDTLAISSTIRGAESNNYNFDRVFFGLYELNLGVCLQNPLEFDSTIFDQRYNPPDSADTSAAQQAISRYYDRMTFADQLEARGRAMELEREHGSEESAEVNSGAHFSTSSHAARSSSPRRFSSSLIRMFRRDTGGGSSGSGTPPTSPSPFPVTTPITSKYAKKPNPPG